MGRGPASAFLVHAARALTMSRRRMIPPDPPAADPQNASAARGPTTAATCAALELATLLEVLAHYSATDLGHARILDLHPARSEDELRARRVAFEEVDRLVPTASLVPPMQRPLAPLLAALGQSLQQIDGRDIVALADLVRVAEAARARIAATDPPLPTLGARADELRDLGGLLHAIDRALDRRGNVRDDATPELVRFRARVHSVRDRLYGELGTFADQHREMLGDDTVPLRGGRLVLVVKSGSKRRLAGLTHGRSGSGQSVYFEPLLTVDLNNQLQQSVEDEAAERRRILATLVDQLRHHAEDLEACGDFVAELDSLQVLVRYRQATDGRLATLTPRHELTLVAARHPLIDPALAAWRAEALGTAGHQGPVVPLDLALDAQRRLLVVTGPNAGGKTVALKTVGLLALTHGCGLPVPARAGTGLPFLRTVVATVGDEQDLLADRSTFSGRLLRLGEAWTLADEDALVLLDELGSGTDPEEGTALSVALLEHLVQCRCLALATTHLTRVAAAAIDLEGGACAAMAFDGQTGGPTYRLLPGPPGGSEAIALGRRLGLAATWLVRAEALLDPQHSEFRRLLAEVEASRQALEQAQAGLATEREDLARLVRRTAERERELAAERQRVGRQLRDRLDQFRLETRRRFAAEIERLTPALQAVPAGPARQRRLASEATARIFREAPVPVEETAITSGPIEIGKPVRHRGLGWQGVLEKLARGKAQVRVGGKLLRCSASDLSPARDVTRASRKQPEPPPRAEASGPGLASTPAELMLIGERVEPALERLDRFLDQALLAGTAEVRVVHGHGSGRLRRAVREHLGRHRGVAAHRAGGAREGGDGATIAVLLD